MAVRVLRDTDSLDFLWEELVYTEARLKSDPHAKDFAPHFAKLLARLYKVREKQQETVRAEVLARAAVDAVDDALDDTVTRFARDLLYADESDRKSARFKRYFASRPSDVVRLGLQAELAKVATWAPALKGESEKSLKAYGKLFEQHLHDGLAALAERATAASARADHRVREIVPLIDDLNATRISVFGALTTRVAKEKLARDWPQRFFRTVTRAPRAPAEEPAPPAEQPAR